jgi:hypothetical protein
VENQQLVPPIRQCSSTPVRFDQVFLGKKNSVTTLEHPPYCPDLATADVYLLLRLKSTLKGRRFCDIAGIIRNATKELKSLSQNGFQECFQHLA